ncbi:MAG TPA: hypothetical protein VH143_15265 [Kofleriaceae bacterium]|nr:hypothetical protein [Kofleriaceae bacterium]
MRRERLLKLAAKRRRGRERTAGSAQRQQAVAVDLLELDVELRTGRGNHARQEEAGLLVGDDGTRVAGERGQEAFACAWLRLDIRHVRDVRALERGRVVAHAFDHERVVAVTGPAIAGAQRLEHRERFVELGCELTRAIERDRARSCTSCAAPRSSNTGRSHRSCESRER